MKLTFEMQRQVRDMADGGETDNSIWHKLREIGYKGNKDGLNSIVKVRRELQKTARESGPLARALLALSDEEQELLESLFDAVAAVDVEGPVSLRRWAAAHRAIAQALGTAQSAPREAACRVALALFTEFNIDGAAEYRARVDALFPSKDEVDEH